MKRALAAALCLMFGLCTLAGCGGGGPSVRVEEDGTPLGKYESPLVIDTIKYLDPTVAGNLSKLTAQTGETLEDNRWTREYSDKLNIQIRYSLSGSGDAFYNSWAGYMAGGDLPDVFPVGLSDYKDLVEAGLIWDMTDLYEQYSTELTKEVLAESGDSIFDAIEIDGRFYGIPLPKSQYDSYKYLWIRRDWMQKVGVTEAPKTVYELIDLMGKFVEQKPGGQENTYAFALANDLWYNLEGFFWCFGAYPDSWILDEDGNVKLGAIDESMREPLRILQKMYHDGWIDPEFATRDYEKSKSLVANGQVGIYMGAHYNATDFLLPSYNKDGSADWAVFPWPGRTENEVVKGQLELGMSEVLVVNKQFSNPEAAFKLLNLYYENLYGETGNYDYWGNDEVDQIWAIGPLFSYRATVNVTPYRELREVLEGNKSASELKGTSKDYYDSVVTEGRYDWNIMFGDASSEVVSGGQSAGYYLDLLESGGIPSFVNVFTGAPTPSMSIYGAELGTQSLVYFTSAIKGDKNVDADFDAYVEAWKNGGGNKMTEEANEWYRSVSV